MTELSDFFALEAIRIGVPAMGKKPLFQALGELAEQVYGINAREVAERLNERERLGSTGFGGGVAIPHGKLGALEQVVGVLMRLAQPIEFAAVDDMPVDLVVMLLSPLDAGADHLKALALVSRALRDRVFVAKLRGAASADAIAALFATGSARDAA